LTADNMDGIVNIVAMTTFTAYGLWRPLAAHAH